MDYPRKMMQTMELVRECGFSYNYLLNLAHRPGQTFAYRPPGTRIICWDTQKLQKYLVKNTVR